MKQPLTTIVCSIIAGLTVWYITTGNRRVPTIDADVFVLPFVDPARPLALRELKFEDQLKGALVANAKERTGVPSDDLLAKAQEYDRIKSLADAGCAYAAVITNNTGRPAKQLKLTGKNVIGFTRLIDINPKIYEPEKRVETTLASALSIPQLDPPDVLKVVVYTSSNCTYDGFLPDDLHFFTDDQSVNISYVTLPGFVERWRHGGIYDLFAAFGVICASILALGLVAAQLKKLGLIADIPAAAAKALTAE